MTAAGERGRPFGSGGDRCGEEAGVAARATEPSPPSPPLPRLQGLAPLPSPHRWRRGEPNGRFPPPHIRLHTEGKATPSRFEGNNGGQGRSRHGFPRGTSRGTEQLSATDPKLPGFATEFTAVPHAKRAGRRSRHQNWRVETWKRRATGEDG